MSDQLHIAAEEFVGADSVEDVVQVSTRTITELTDADDAVFVFVDDDLLERDDSPRIDSLVQQNQRQIVEGVLGQSLHSGETIVVDDLLDTRSTSVQSASCVPRLYRSLLSAPVADWGILVALDHEEGAFSETETADVEMVTSYTDAALDRINAHIETRDRDRLLREVANVLSHDVRNPLMVAHNHLEIVRETGGEPDQLDRAATALERLEELIDDVVSLARTGERIETAEDVVLGEIASRAWMTVDTADAELDVVDSAVLQADGSGLCQLFENLFRNAAEHAGSTVTVQVGTLRTSDGFYVEDDGSGIPRDKRETVFERGYSTTKDQTGLGLNIVQRIVAAHDWEITVATSEAGGTRYEITDVALSRD